MIQSSDDMAFMVSGEHWHIVFLSFLGFAKDESVYQLQSLGFLFYMILIHIDVMQSDELITP